MYDISNLRVKAKKKRKTRAERTAFPLFLVLFFTNVHHFYTCLSVIYSTLLSLSPHSLSPDLFLFLSTVSVSLSFTLFSLSLSLSLSSPLNLHKEGAISHKVLIIILFRYFQSPETSKSVHSHVLRFPNRRKELGLKEVTVF